MTAQQAVWSGATRQGGLRRFALAITALNLAGHSVLGFEQSWAQPLVALAAAYSAELLLETLAASLEQRRPRFVGGPTRLLEFLLSAHITGLAVSMLLYANARLGVVAFGAVLAIASKALLRAPCGSGTRHFLNPSNFGITATLLLFPWVGIAPPYQFTEGLGSRGDWALPALVVCLGTFLNGRFTRRLPLIAAWLGGFAAQALLRSLVQGTPVQAALLPMTGMTFLLYSFYMLTDPATTPESPRGQVFFGFATAATYGVLMLTHVVFGLFVALTIVTGLRGALLSTAALLADRQVSPLGDPSRLATGPGA
jgi:hypothetical protein